MVEGLYGDRIGDEEVNIPLLKPLSVRVPEAGDLRAAVIVWSPQL